MKLYFSTLSPMSVAACFALLALTIHHQANAATVTTTATGPSVFWSDNTAWSSARTGTINVTSASAVVTGTGTKFQMEGLTNGDVLVEDITFLLTM